MRLLIVLTCCLGVSVGCSLGNSDNQTNTRIVPTSTELRILRVEGIDNPNSRRGQQRLRSLAKERAFLKEAREKRRESVESRRRNRVP